MLFNLNTIRSSSIFRTLATQLLAFDRTVQCWFVEPLRHCERISFRFPRATHSRLDTRPRLQSRRSLCGTSRPGTVSGSWSVARRNQQGLGRHLARAGRAESGSGAPGIGRGRQISASPSVCWVCHKRLDRESSSTRGRTPVGAWDEGSADPWPVRRPARYFTSSSRSSDHAI